jgi:hypothetical protein
MAKHTQPDGVPYRHHLRASTPKPRSVVPIPSTMTNIRGYPSKLVIFQVPASPYWWVRYYDGRPIKRSTRTSDKTEAIAAAKKFYEEVLLKRREGISNNPRKSSFVACAEGLMEEDRLKAERQELSRPYVTSQRQIISKHVLNYFNRYEIGEIDYARLDQFKTFLFTKQLAPNSIKLHFAALSKIFGYAERMKIIKTSPLAPKISNDDNPRGFFTIAEYKHLRRTAHKLVGKVSKVTQTLVEDGEEVSKNLRNIVITRQVCLLIQFMVYSFVRPADIKNAKHRHIEARLAEEGEYLWMPLPTSKGHSTPMVSMTKAALAYKKIRDLRLKELGDPNADISDEYVFEPEQLNRSYAYRKLARQFDVVIDEANLRFNADGDRRTLYSLRHTSLMWRLRYGGEVNPLVLAKNARTSVEMLERFYLSKIESTQFTSALLARKAGKRPAKQKSIHVGPPTDLASHLLKNKLPDSVGSRKLTVDATGKLVLAPAASDKKQSS